MPNYTYSARDARGALQRGQLEAADRATALATLKARGLAPVSLESGAVMPGRRLPTWWRAALLALALLGSLAVALLWPGKKSRPQRSGTPNPATAREDPAGAPRTPQAQETPAGAVHLPAKADEAAGASLAEGAAPSLLQGDQASAPVPEVEEPAADKPATRIPFKTITEQTLSIIASMPPGVAIPPMPPISGMDRDFARAATNILEIHDEDSDELAGRLEAVAWAKLDLKELVDQGWKADEALDALVKAHNENANWRSATALTLKRMLDAGQVTPDQVLEELPGINKDLARERLPEITPIEIGIAGQ